MSSLGICVCHVHCYYTFSLDLAISQVLLQEEVSVVGIYSFTFSWLRKGVALLIVRTWSVTRT